AARAAEAAGRLGRRDRFPRAFPRRHPRSPPRRAPSIGMMAAARLRRAGRSDRARTIALGSTQKPGDPKMRLLSPKMTLFRGIQALAAVSLLALGAGAARADEYNPLADHVRAALDRFKDVAVAVKEGYAPIPCAGGIEGGAMGIHYVNK